MKRKLLSLTLALVLVLSFSLVTAVPVAAQPIGDPFFTTDGLGTAWWSTEQATFGDYSAKLYIPPWDSQRLPVYDEARVVFNYDGDLNSIIGVSYPSYVIGGNDGALYPMVVLAVDSTGDDNVDSWVCQWGPYAHIAHENAWETISFDGGSPVHVAGARTGLPEDQYRPFTTPTTETDTLTLLKGETGWGDFKVLEVKVFMGMFTNLLTQDMTAYVDDVTINSILYELEPAAQAPVELGAAGNFAILASSTVTNTGATVVTGDVGLSPGVSVTGFSTSTSTMREGATSTGLIDGPGTVIGTIHIADTAIDPDESATSAAQAQLDLTTAYNDAAGRAAIVTGTELGGTTKAPGAYSTASGEFGITGTLTLDADGDSDAVFIFQAGSTLITATDSVVYLTGGAQACNVFWQVGSSATLGTGTTFSGTIMALTAITVELGTTVDGRLLARNAAVTISGASTITAVSVSAIKISPDAATILTGGTQVYTAVALDEDGDEIGDVTADTIFSIDEDAGGSWTYNTYTSEEYGTWTVTGTFGAFEDTATLRVDGISLNKAFYKTGDTVEVTVGYQAGNTDPAIAQTAQVKAKSTSTDIDEVIIAVHENGPDTGIFTGTFTLVNTSPGVGQLLMGDGDAIIVTFYPPDTDYVATATVDETAPEFAADTEADTDYYANEDTITLTVTLDDVGDTVTADFSAIDSGYTTGDEDFTDDGGGVYTVTYDISAGNTMLDGEYAITVMAEDTAGNSATDDSCLVSLDNTVPLVTEAAADPKVLQPDEATNVTFTATVTDEGSGVATVTIDLSSLPSGSATQAMIEGAPGVYTYTWTGLTVTEEDDYDLSITATDDVGKVNDTVVITLRVVADVTDPVIESTEIEYPVGFESARVGDDVIITAVVTDDLAGVDTVTIDATAIGLTDAEALTLTDENTYRATLTVQAGTKMGTKTLTIVATDYADNSSDIEVTVEVTLRLTAYNIGLSEGWNLISLPLIPDDASIDVVLADISSSVAIVQYYYNSGPEDQGWLWYQPGLAESTLTSMEDGKGYWVNMSSSATLTITGKEMPLPPALPPTYAVNEGWNLIGFKSVGALDNTDYLVNIVGGYSVLWGYDAVEGYFNVHPMNEHPSGGDLIDVGDMEVGHGYWLWATESGIIVPVQ